MNHKKIYSKLIGNSRESLKRVTCEDYWLPVIMNEYSIPIYSLPDKSIALAKLDQSCSKLYSFFKGTIKTPAKLIDETQEYILKNINHMLHHKYYVRITVSLNHLPTETRGTGYDYNIINLFGYDDNMRIYYAFGNDQEHRYRPFVISENELIIGMKNISDQTVEMKYYTNDIKDYLEILSKYIKSYETKDNIFGQKAFLQYINENTIDNEFLITLFDHFLLTKQRMTWLHHHFVVSPINLEEYEATIDSLKKVISYYLEDKNVDYELVKSDITTILRQENDIIYDFIKRFYAWNDNKLRVL